MLIDTHAHLSDPQFDSDRESVIKRAFSAGLLQIVEIADRHSEWEKARQLADSYSGRIFWTAGNHPYYADQFTESLAQQMVEVTRHPACVAVGEIGLDYAKARVPADLQQRVFRRCLEIAAEVRKPVVIHCREAQGDMLRILRSFYRGLHHEGMVQGVIHCFQGSRDFAEGCLELGFTIGVDGPVTYPSAQNLREVLKTLPLNRMVLETDSPYLPPQIKRGKRNEPALLTEIASSLADLFKVTIELIAEKTTRSAHTLFHLPQ